MVVYAGCLLTYIKSSNISSVGPLPNLVSTRSAYFQHSWSFLGLELHQYMQGMECGRSSIKEIEIPDPQSKFPGTQTPQKCSNLHSFTRLCAALRKDELFTIHESHKTRFQIVPNTK